MGGVWFSSNYVLYGDMSSRVMTILEGMAPVVEVYRIDEAFIELSESWATDLVAYGRQVRERVHQDARQLCCQEVARYWRRGRSEVSYVDSL